MISVRSLFVSDLHLGFRHAQAGPFLDWLQQFSTESLYLVGDFLDGWRLSRNWYWPRIYDEIMDHILRLADRGVRICYTPGNHDEFLRDPHPSIDRIVITDEFTHTMADGRRFLVTHGDLFDSVEKRFHAISQAGSQVYDLLMSLNRGTNRVTTAMGAGNINYCFAVKRWSKSLIGSASSIPAAVRKQAIGLGCDGAIFGHLHHPAISVDEGFAVCNTGDWVENQSAIIEQLDGTLELVNHGRRIARLTPNIPANHVT
jgi:UDP-2,3-diacylglucosamine pyrophosphatase LpxH